jgi:hypothetical protein
LAIIWELLGTISKDKDLKNGNMEYKEVIVVTNLKNHIDKSYAAMLNNRNSVVAISHGTPKKFVSDKEKEDNV